LAGRVAAEAREHRIDLTLDHTDIGDCIAVVSHRHMH
jgi:hypothetical protein